VIETRNMGIHGSRCPNGRRERAVTACSARKGIRDVAAPCQFALDAKEFAIYHLTLFQQPGAIREIKYH